MFDTSGLVKYTINNILYVHKSFLYKFEAFILL